MDIFKILSNKSLKHISQNWFQLFIKALGKIIHSHTFLNQNRLNINENKNFK